MYHEGTGPQTHPSWGRPKENYCLKGQWGPGSEGGCEGGFLCQLLITPKHQEPSRQMLSKQAKAPIQGTELPLSSMALLSRAFTALLSRATPSTFSFHHSEFTQPHQVQAAACSLLHQSKSSVTLSQSDRLTSHEEVIGASKSNQNQHHMLTQGSDLLNLVACLIQKKLWFLLSFPFHSAAFHHKPFATRSLCLTLNFAFSLVWTS